MINVPVTDYSISRTASLSQGRLVYLRNGSAGTVARADILR